LIMLVRELASALAILVGGALVILAVIASGWWSLAWLGGSALVCVGLVTAAHRIPEQGDDAGRPPAPPS
jgi:apolipoprotein N-acyltransferase